MPPRSPVRRVYFYRVALGIDDDGRPRDFDPGPALRMVDELDFENGDRYLDRGEGDVTCCWVDSHRYPHRVRLARVRRDFLPQLERAGTLTDLDLPPGAGLAEQTHIVFFRYNIVGTLFNWYGPRVTHMRDYLTDRCDEGFGALDFEALVRRDVLDRLNRLRTVKGVELSVSRSYFDRVDRAGGGLLRGLRDLGQYDVEEFKIEMKPARYSRNVLNRDIVGWVRELLERDDLEELVHVFKIRGLDDETGRRDTIDLLGDQFIVTQEVEFERGQPGVVRDASAYEAIIGARTMLGDALLFQAGAAT